jgi:hypothetical protein
MNRMFSIAILPLLFGSCGGYKFYTIVSTEDRYQTKMHFSQYPGLHPLGYTLFRRDEITDLADGRIVQQKKIIDGTNLMIGFLLYRSKTTFYDTLGRKMKVIKSRRNKTKVIDRTHHPLMAHY